MRKWNAILTAAIMALTTIHNTERFRGRSVTLFSDSQYVKNGITSWIHGWKKNGWGYHDPNNADDPGDGYFYYSGKLKSGQLTPRLLDKVELSEAAYALTENNTYRLRIDVLADAIQTSGGAESQRGWEP